MNQILRAAKFANAPSVLVTAQEVVVPRVYKNFNVAHYKYAKTMPRDLLLEEIPKHEGLYCLVNLIFFFIFYKFFFLFSGLGLEQFVLSSNN